MVRCLTFTANLFLALSCSSINELSRVWRYRIWLISLAVEMCLQIRPGCEICGLITTRCVAFWNNRGKYKLVDFCYIKMGQFWLSLLCMSLTNDNKTPCHCCYENADVLTNRKRCKCCYDTPATLSWQKEKAIAKM